MHPFKLADAKLYPEAGACTKCPFNTANSPTLFDDMKGKNCSRNSCFTIKTHRAYTAIIQKEVIDGGKLPVLSNDYYVSNDDKVFIKLAKDMGVEPINSELFTRPYEPIPLAPPDSFERWMEHEDYDLTDPAEEKAARECYKDFQDDYKDELKMYNEELEAWNNRGPNRKEAIIISGGCMGETIEILLKPVENKASGDGGTDTVIADLLEKAEREIEKENKEFYEKLRGMATRDNAPEDQPFDMTEFWNVNQWATHYQCLYTLLNAMALYDKLGDESKESVNQFLTGVFDPEEDEVISAMEKKTTDAIDICLRYLVADSVFAFRPSYNTWNPKLSEAWMKEFMPTAYTELTTSHQALVEGRKEKLQKRINSIRKKAEKALELEVSETN